MLHKLKNDRYRKNRGSYSRLLAISCASCNELVALYQKDGPGALKRMYLDRIYQSDYSDLVKKPLNELPQLVCRGCGSFLGVPMMYEKEKRLAFRLFAGSVAKKIVKAGKRSEMMK